jgi:hypothetical protein
VHAQREWERRWGLAQRRDEERQHGQERVPHAWGEVVPFVVEVR